MRVSLVEVREPLIQQSQSCRDPCIREDDLEDHSSGVSYLSAVGILQICKVSILPVLDHFGIALAVQTSTRGMV